MAVKMADTRSPSPSTENGPQKLINGKSEVNDRVKKEMLKPLVFGNHQGKFKFFTFAFSAGTVMLVAFNESYCMYFCYILAVTWYLVFQHDFGQNRHCFSWVSTVAVV